MGNLPFQDIGKDCRAGFFGPLTLEALLSQDGLPANQKIKTSLMKRRGKAPRHSRKTHTFTFIIVFLNFTYEAQSLEEAKSRVQELDQ